MLEPTFKERPMDEDSDKKSDAGGVQAVVFALELLEYLAKQRDAVRMTDLAAAFGTNKSRIYRHLRTLLLQGYIVQDAESERYRIGTRLIALGRSVSENVDLVRAGADAMVALRDRLEHSVVIAQAQDTGVQVLSVLPGMSAIGIVVKPGSTLEFHSSAQGKIALAFGSQEAAERVMQLRLKRHSPATITTTTRLRGEIEQIRDRGWAVAPNEAMVGLNALAAPVFDVVGALAGSIAIVDSVQFISEQPSKEQIRAVLQAARQISQNLGYAGTHCANFT